jgi:hypothetical protein
MAYENINFKAPHFAIKGDYFCFIDQNLGILQEKTCDGTTAFTYPFVDQVGSNTIKCLHYDGYYFWSLQQGTTNQDLIIKKWQITNYFCRLIKTIELDSSMGISFQGNTFSVEWYKTTLSGVLNRMDTEVVVNSYYDRIEPGMELIVGPNNDDYYETLTVTGTLDSQNKFGLDFFVKYEYPDETPVYFTKNLWLINSYNSEGIDSSIYKIKLPQNDLVNVLEDEDFEYVTASCFYLLEGIPHLVMSIGTNLRIMDLDTYEVVRTMTMDNINVSNVILNIYAMQIHQGTLYRLQNSATYYEDDDTFSTYNYQPSPLRSFVDSVSITTYPKILPSDGMSTANVTFIVNDQYGHPLYGSIVEFEDSDNVGFITINPVRTNLFGVAKTYYKSGTVPDEVIIAGKAIPYE